MKKIAILAVVCLIAVTAHAQDVYNSSGRAVPRKQQHKNNGFNTDNLVLGGDVRLNIGSYINVGISPMVGYKIADNFFAGVKLGYNFRREKYTFVNTFKNPATEDNFVFKQNVYSGSLWARYIVFQNFFLHVEAEANVYDLYDGSYNLDPMTNNVKYIKKSVTAPSILIGGGIKQPISDRTSFIATVVYDVLQDNYSFYNKQLDIRFGILVGF